MWRAVVTKVIVLANSWGIQITYTLLDDASLQ